MASSSQTLIREEITSAVTTVSNEPQVNQPPPVTVLKLRRPRTEKKVEWTNDTVDNENMNKKKSKCCCIYEKKKEFGGSDSEDSEDECDNCSGHVDRKKHRPTPEPNAGDPAPQNIS